MKIAIAIVHGIGSQQRGFSHDLQRGIASYYQQAGLNWDDLLFQEVLWADLLIETQKTLFEKTNYRHDLNYLSFRQFFIDYLSDVIAFQPGCTDESDTLPMRDAIFARMSEAMESFIGVEGVDGEKTPLVIISHSLGSVISFDYCWHHQRDQHKSAFECAHTLAGFITLGSPLALWTSRYKNFGKPFDFPGKQLSPAMQQAAQWLNLYDKDDIIAYPLKGLSPDFEQTVSEDIAINVGNPLKSWNPLSHTSYWQDKDSHRYIAEFLVKLHSSF